MAILRSVLHFLWMGLTVVPWAIALMTASIFVRGERDANDAVTALAWDAAGRRLAFGTKDGKAGVLDLPA